MSNDKSKISTDTQIHRKSVFRRGTKGQRQKVKQSFHYVICGVMIITTLTGSLLVPNMPKASAASVVSTSEITTTVDMPKTNAIYTTGRQVDESSATALNLKQANKVLSASISSGSMSASFYDRLTSALNGVKKQLANAGTNDIEVLKPLVSESDNLLYKQLPSDITKDVIESRERSLVALESVQKLMGGSDGSATTTDVVFTQMAMSSEGKPTITNIAASTSVSSTIKVLLDGKVQKYDQAPVMQSGTVLVPMRGIFESLGATVKYTAKTKTVDAVKGDIKVSLVLGKSTATVNGKTVKLTVPANAIKGSTMVPLRFVSESLGADVKWDQASKTVAITSGNGGTVVTPPVTTPISDSVTLNVSPTNKHAVSVPKSQWQEVTVYTYTPTKTGYTRSNPVKIKVEFGDHTYGAQNQKEYDYVMKNVKESVDKLFAPGGEYDKAIDPNGKMVMYREAFEGYKKGERAADIGRSKGTDYVQYLLSVENMGALVDNGMKFEEMIKFNMLKSVLYKYDTVARDPGDSTPRSAYDMMYHKLTDCDPQSYLTAAILDYMGYNTAAFINSGHAQPVAQVGGKWYIAQDLSMYNDTARTFDQIKALGLRNNGQMIEGPTYANKI